MLLDAPGVRSGGNSRMIFPVASTGRIGQFLLQIPPLLELGVIGSFASCRTILSVQRSESVGQLEGQDCRQMLTLE